MNLFISHVEIVEDVTFSMFQYDMNLVFSVILVDSRVSVIQTRVTMSYPVIIFQPRSNSLPEASCTDDDEAARELYQVFNPDFTDASCATL